MSEVQVAVTAEEIEAEVIRSRLEAEGIPARIAAKSQIGMPASWSPQGLGYGIGSFSVRVPREYARLAREAIGDTRGERRPRTSTIVRVIATVLLIYVLIGMAISLTQLLPELLSGPL